MLAMPWPKLRNPGMTQDMIREAPANIPGHHLQVPLRIELIRIVGTKAPRITGQAKPQKVLATKTMVTATIICQYPTELVEVGLGNSIIPYSSARMKMLLMSRCLGKTPRKSEIGTQVANG